MGRESKGLGWGGNEMLESAWGEQGQDQEGSESGVGKTREACAGMLSDMIVVGAILCRAGVQKQAVHNWATRQEQNGLRRSRE